MANETKRPSAQQFLSDPEFQGERDLFTAFCDDYMRKLKIKADEDAAKNPQSTNFFDRLFGGK